MEGKADMLPANRTLSALIVVCLLLSGLAGFLFFLNSPLTKAQPSGDLVVSGTYVIQDMVQPVDGNVIVNNGGHLIVKDGTLSIISNAADVGQHHTITVNLGGTLTLDHGTVTSYLDQIDPYPFLTITVNGGTFEASGDSLLQFPGSIVLTASASVTLNDTTVTSLSLEEVNEFVVRSSGGISADEADDGPSISVANSNLYLFDSAIRKLPEYATYAMSAKNLSLTGSSELLAVNSFIGVDFGPVNSPIDWFTHNVLSIADSSTADLYGCDFEPYTGANADRAPAIVSSGDSLVALPATKGAGDTTVGQDIASLWQSSDSWTYHVAPGLRMYIDSFSAGAPSAINSAKLLVRYMVESRYNGNQSVMWNVQGGVPASTGIKPLGTETSFVEKSFDLYAAGVTTTGAISTLDVSFLNDGTLGDVQFDSISIMISIGSQAYVYRWLNVTVGDEYGVPIPGAAVSAVFTGSTTFGGQPAFYFGHGSPGPLPPSLVLNYLGKNGTTFAVTGSDGIALVPYLTDLVTGDQAPNSLFVGSLGITGTANVGGTIYSSSSTFSFPAYPAMSAADRSFDHTVKIMGVSAQSPNPSRWLVVPPSIMIKDMTYYHAGDVIVAAGGTLWFKNAEFQLVEAYPNQRTVYVDGTLAEPAKLLFEQSTVVSDMPINFIVQGDGVLMANDTVFQGVNIIALEDSQVIFHNVTMDGNITTAWNSGATISVYDSELAEPITLSGMAIGGFTNTSVPSVVVEDDAIAYIYRWIHVTVIDGAGYPCPNAIVATRYFLNDTPAASSVSDSMGVARVSSTGTIITATGSTFVGNYKVNTSLTHAGSPYYAEEISVGVMPYTEPLGRNATYAMMTIPGALPDLTLLPGAVSAYPSSPRNHELTYLNVTVTNVGAVAAHNVSADFNDTTESGTAFIGTSSIDVVPVDGSAVISLLWMAHEPLDPKDHNISVDVDPFNEVPELVETHLSAYLSVTVQNLPDVEVRSEQTEIWTEPAAVVVNNAVNLRANVHNVGDQTTGDVAVEFYDEPQGSPRTFIGWGNVTAIAKDHLAIASVTWTPDVQDTHKVYVFVNGGSTGTHLFTEISYANNEANKIVTVLGPPDLVVSSDLAFSPSGSIPGGDTLQISAVVRNTELAPVTYTTAALYANNLSQAPLLTQDIRVTLVDGGSTTIVFNYPTPQVTSSTDVRFYVVVNPSNATPEEITYDNNVGSGIITLLDMRPDLAIMPSAISVKSGSSNISGSTYGRMVTVEATVHNFGGQSAENFTVMLGVRNETSGYNHTLKAYVCNISAVAGNDTTVVTFQWDIRLTAWADYDIWVWVDVYGTTSEKVETNNFASIVFTINPLQVDVLIVPDKAEYTAGDMIYITVTIYYLGTSDPVPDVPLVMLRLVDSNGDPVPDSDTGEVNATAFGQVTQTLAIPTSLRTGSYDIVAVFLGDTHPSSSPATVTISALVSAGLFPMWVWFVIIAVVVAAVLGFTVYTYKYGLGKYVECGECGAFIPAASKRCPKCGVEFEAGTMKCSECGAWIPAESTECPNCGVKFVGEAEEEADYLERMRKEYDEMVSKYRELAKPELGKKYSDKAFEEWWKKQPGYITFDDWLAKEEEKKKEGPIPCPVCGTLNPKEATVCHKCGTVFGAAREGLPPTRRGPPPAAQPAAVPPREVERPVEAPTPPEAAVPGAAPRMVIRRPIEKKVVPKKIIRTPTGQVVEEKEEGEQKEDENNQ